MKKSINLNINAAIYMGSVDFIKFIKCFLILTTIAIVTFLGINAYADLDYKFIENPPKFYLAENHVYLEIESTQFTEGNLEVSYIYKNDSGEEYEFGIKEYNGSDVCKVVRQNSSTTYFHCELGTIPKNALERLVMTFKKEEGSKTIPRLLVGYKKPPVQNEAGLPNYTKTFVYSDKFADSDNDGFDDAIDNCPYAEDPDQNLENDCPSSFENAFDHSDEDDDVAPSAGGAGQQGQGGDSSTSGGSDGQTEYSGSSGTGAQPSGRVLDGSDRAACAMVESNRPGTFYIFIAAMFALTFIGGYSLVRIVILKSEVKKRDEGKRGR